MFSASVLFKMIAVATKTAFWPSTKSNDYGPLDYGSYPQSIQPDLVKNDCQMCNVMFVIKITIAAAGFALCCN